MTAIGRDIVPGDRAGLAAVMTVMAAAFDPAHGEAWTGPQLLTMLGLPQTRLVLVGELTAPQGFALTRRVLDESELLLLAVMPAGRRRGIAQTLLDEIECHEAQKGASQIFLEVRESNIAAISLYSNREYRIIGRRPGYYRGSGGKSVDALTMAKYLICQ